MGVVGFYVGVKLLESVKPLVKDFVAAGFEKLGVEQMAQKAKVFFCQIDHVLCAVHNSTFTVNYSNQRGLL